MEQTTKILNITLLIKQINLTVRFPCSVCLSLRCGNNYVDSRAQHQLLNGIAKMQDKISLQIEVDYFNQKYEDKTVNLMITMVSSNGKITAGSVEIDVVKQGVIWENHSQRDYAINKCPDKMAKALIHKSIEFVRDGQRYRNVSRSVRTNSLAHLLSGNKKLAVTSSHQQSKVRYPHMTSPIAKLNTSIERSNQKNYVFKSKRFQEESSENESRDPKPLKFDEDSMHIQLESNQDISELPHRKPILNSRPVSSHNNHPEISSHFYSHRKELETYAIQIQQYRQKWKAAQKKSQQAEKQVSSLHEQCEKYKNKSLQLDTAVSDKQLELEKKVKEIKEMEGLLNVMKEKIEELELQVKASEKKNAFKDANYKQQSNKINEKYQKCQQERLSAVFNLNEKIKELQQIERNHQIQQRDRDKYAIEEKNKLQKKIDTLQMQLSQVQEKFTENQAILQTKLSLITQQTRKQNQLEAKIDELTQSLTTKDEQNNKLKLLLVSSSKQADELRNYENQEKSHKMKIQKLTHEISEKQQALRIQKKSNEKLVSELKQKEKIMKDLTTKQHNLQLRISGINRENEICKENLEHYQKMESEFVREIGELKHQIEAIRVKNQSESLENSRKIIKYEQDISILKKQKEKVSIIAKGNRNSAANIQDKCNTLSQALDEAHREIQILNEELFNQKAQSNKAISQNEDLHRLFNSQKDFSAQLEAQQQKLIKQLKQKAQTIYHLQSNLTQIQQKLQTTQKQAEKTLKVMQQQLMNLQIFSNEQTQKIEQKKTYEAQCENTIRQLRLEKQFIERELSREKEQVKQLSDSQRINKGQIAQLQQKVNNLSNQIISVRNEKEMLEMEMRKIDRDYEEARAHLKNSKEISFKNRDEIRQMIEKVCQQLKNQISQKQSTQKMSYRETYCFWDGILDHQLAQTLKKNSQYILNIQNKVLFLTQTNQYLQSELKSCFQSSQTQIQALTDQTTSLKQHQKLKLEKNQSEIEALLEKIRIQEQQIFQLNIEKDRLNKENHTLVEANHQLEGQLSRLENMINILKQEKQQLNRHLARLESSTDLQKNLSPIVYKMSHHSELGHESRCSSVSDQSPQHPHKNIFSTKKYLALEEKISQMDQQIQEKNKEINDLSTQKRQLINKSQQLESQLRELQARLLNYQSNLKQKAVLLQEKSEEIKKQQETHMQLLKKIKEYELKADKIASQNQQLNKRYQSLSIEHSDLQEKHSLLDKSQISQSHNFEDTIKQLQNQIHEHKQLHLKSQSEIQLKEFIISQKEKQLEQVKDQLGVFEKMADERKKQVFMLHEKINTLENTILEKQSNLQAFKVQSSKYRKQAEGLKGKNQTLTQEINQCEVLNEIAKTKDRELKRLKQEYLMFQQKSENSIKQIKSELLTLKQENISLTQKLQDLKKKYRAKQQEIESCNYSIRLSKQKYRDKSDREMKDILEELQREKMEKNGVIISFENFKMNAEREIQSLKKSIKTTIQTRNSRDDDSTQKKFKRNTLLTEGSDNKYQSHLRTEHVRLGGVGSYQYRKNIN